MAGPSVSVIIPCFQAQATIALQLASLSDQVDAPSFEVILVDNDPAQRLDEDVADFLHSSAFDLRIVRAHEHQGSSYARNVGISHARAESLQFCDADDVVSRTWVRNGHLSTLDSLLWTGESILLTEAPFSAGLEAVRREFDAPPPEWSAPADKQTGPFPVLMAGNFGAARSTLLELQGFDQGFAHYGDDNDLAFRSRRDGHRVPVAESVRIAYRGKWSATQRMRRGFHDARARRRLLIVHGASSQSPVPPWPVDIARCLAATVLMPFRRSVAPFDVAMRWSHALGNASGSLRFGWPRKAPASTPGHGLSSSPTHSVDPSEGTVTA
ncbi:MULTISPECIES: glycosyltransferase family 2 protein [Brachybacterium]|uniref:glycosyltransferase family 2 protein n=1 Tax=Brachybacterium TaxID=43668 RepID=UPI0006B4421C|nr:MULTISPECIES: glycosyltransferase family A protein [Brachybacterium]GAP77983.1 glycosyltransferase [Brachybacterium sp. SW0106-09]